MDTAEEWCTICKKYSASYSKEEFIFLRQFASYSFPTFICKECYPTLKSFIVQGSHQEQRKFLFKLTNYFGVLDYQTALAILRTNAETNSGGGFFVWEIQLPHPARMDQMVLIVAVTYTFRGRDRSNVLLKFDSGVSDRILDKYTTYIVQGPDGRYYCGYGSEWFVGSFQQLVEFDEWKTYTLVYFGNTLQDALREVHYRHDFLEHINGRCFCLAKPISKYLVIPLPSCRFANPPRYEPWSLQSLAAFKIRNYYFHFQPDLFPGMPGKMKHQIVSSPQNIRDSCIRYPIPRIILSKSVSDGNGAAAAAAAGSTTIIAISGDPDSTTYNNNNNKNNNNVEVVNFVCCPQVSLNIPGLYGEDISSNQTSLAACFRVSSAFRKTFVHFYTERVAINEYGVDLDYEERRRRIPHTHMTDTDQH